MLAARIERFREMNINQIILASALLLYGVMALSLGLNLDGGVFVVVRIVGATSILGALPGMTIILAFPIIKKLTLLELIGLGIAVSLGAFQVLTIISMTLHISLSSIITLYLIANLLLIVYAIVRSPSAMLHITTPPEGTILLALLFITMVITFIAGSPIAHLENHIHVGVIRRLMEVENPALNNVYITPDTVYTYPFPGTHFSIAAIASVADYDALFVFHKLRFFWALGAILFVYLGALRIVEDSRAALTVGVVAVGLTLSGGFATVPGYFWAQLAPTSHASDIAMNVLLPGLLVLFFFYLQATRQRETIFYYIATMLLVVMVTIVHAREVVQFVVYAGSFLLALILFMRNRAMLVRTVILIVSVLVFSVLYQAWHKTTVIPSVYQLIELEEDLLVESVEGYTLLDWIFNQYRYGAFVNGMSIIFYKWFPLGILGSILVAFLYRQKPLAAFLGSSILAYALILQIPILTFSYIYFTYHEILFTPVRNFVFFVYIVIGIILHLIAVNLLRLKQTMAIPLAIGIGFALYGIVTRLPELLSMREGFLLFPAVVGLLIVLVSIRLAPNVERWAKQVRFQGPLQPTLMAVVLLLLPVFVLDTESATSPIHDAWENNYLDQDAYVSDVISDTPDLPNFGLYQWADNELAVDSILAVPVLNVGFASYNSSSFPSMLLAQQIDVWPITAFHSRLNFPEYFAAYDRTQALYGDQPFYNLKETLQERRDFLEQFGITHILVNPDAHQMMSLVFDEYPSYFSPVYDDGEWAVYQVEAQLYAASSADLAMQTPFTPIMLAEDELEAEFERYASEHELVNNDGLVFFPAQGEAVALPLQCLRNTIFETVESNDPDRIRANFDLILTYSHLMSGQSKLYFDDVGEYWGADAPIRSDDIAQWRQTKEPATLLNADIRYLFYDGNWASWLSEEEIAIFQDQQRYQQVGEWTIMADGGCPEITYSLLELQESD